MRPSLPSQGTRFIWLIRSWFPRDEQPSHRIPTCGRQGQVIAAPLAERTHPPLLLLPDAEAPRGEGRQQWGDGGQKQREEQRRFRGGSGVRQRSWVRRTGPRDDWGQERTSAPGGREWGLGPSSVSHCQGFTPGRRPSPQVSDAYAPMATACSRIYFTLAQLSPQGAAAGPPTNGLSDSIAGTIGHLDQTSFVFTN